MGPVRRHTAISCTLSPLVAAPSHSEGFLVVDEVSLGKLVLRLLKGFLGRHIVLAAAGVARRPALNQIERATPSAVLRGKAELEHSTLPSEGGVP
jgi:hypothetical protein